MKKIKNHETQPYVQDESPRLARTVDEAPPILPPQRITRANKPGERPLKMRYMKVGAPLRSGQCGDVYKAIDLDSGRFMAVKILKRPASTSEQGEWRKSIYYSLEREAETLSQISHVGSASLTFCIYELIQISG